MNKFHFFHNSPPLNLRQDLKENLFVNNSKCEDCECDSGSVLDKPVAKRCRRCGAMNIQIGRTCGGEDQGAESQQKQQQYIFKIHDQYSSTRFKQLFSLLHNFFVSFLFLITLFPLACFPQSTSTLNAVQTMHFKRICRRT